MLQAYTCVHICIIYMYICIIDSIQTLVLIILTTRDSDARTPDLLKPRGKYPCGEVTGRQDGQRRSDEGLDRPSIASWGELHKPGFNLGALYETTWLSSGWLF